MGGNIEYRKTCFGLRLLFDHAEIVIAEKGVDNTGDFLRLVSVGI